MVKKVKKAKGRLDKFYYLAKEQGYRSRAAFKLIQLNKKYSFLENSRVLVDLCAAPGGWLQVARKFMPVAGQIFGIDLASIKAIPHVTTIVGDITTKKSIKQLKHEMRGQQADVVLCDGAPNVGANWLKDAYTQAELILAATKFAADVLIPDGLFITKVFRSKDYNSLLWVFSKLFKKVEATKPAATRHTSAEIYVVCQGYLAPKTIDPKLFDPKFIFEDTEPTKKPEFGYQKKKRNREGYDEDNPTLNKRGSVSQFIDSEKPLTMLAEYNQLLWDEPAIERYKNQPETTEEINILLDDLKVLGRIDFRQLLKWRIAMRKVRDETGYDSDASMDNDDDVDVDAVKDEANEDAAGAEPETREEMDEAQMIRDLEALRKKAEKAKKNALKKRKTKLSKLQPRGDTLTERPSDIIDGVDEGSLFSILQIRNKDTLDRVLSASANVDADDYVAGVDGDEEINADSDEDNSGDEDADYDDLLEQQLDALYDRFLTSRKDSQRKAILRRRNEVRRERDYLFLDVDGDAVRLNPDDIDFEDDSANPLLVDLSDKPGAAGSAAQKAKMWFSQPVFDVLKGSTASTSKSAAAVAQAAAKVLAKRKRDDDSSDESNSDSGSDDSDTDDEDYSHLKPQKEAEGYEEVPQEMYDSDTRANTLALATKMLRKKNRREIVDAAYNRYTFGDEDLPKWFADDEARHNKPEAPITKEEVQKIKQRFREISERPIKKVLEAKLRKKIKSSAKLATMKDKATEVADNTEMSAQDKAKALAGLLKKAKAKPKQDKMYVVSKRGIAKAMPNRKGNSVIKRVDGRMKKEARARKRRKQ